MSHPDEIDAMAARLREIAELLQSDDVPASNAAELAREAAGLVTEAGNKLERADGEPT